MLLMYVCVCVCYMMLMYRRIYVMLYLIMLMEVYMTLRIYKSLIADIGAKSKDICVLRRIRILNYIE